ncbi:MAG: hypothetical protein EPN22_13525 [Nitrospirae bacterium]|nr:MAG: hypothetical protein EPN22_13525 [Nitrospirota bacterium]
MRYFYEKIHETIKNSQALFYSYNDQKYSYSECFRNIQKINSLLHKSRNQRIALYASKSFNSYCAIFSILLSGNTWIPLSPVQPDKRTLDMMRVAAPHMIFADCSLPELIHNHAGEKEISIYNINEIIEKEKCREFELGEFHKDDIAYIMFTSGSTGLPKGVPMTHDNYINFVENALEILPFNKHEVFSDYHDFGFDISIFYLFCAILTESAFAPAIRDEERLYFLDNAIKNRVTVFSSVPSTISHIKRLRPDSQIETSIRIMFLCGEPFRLDVLQYCYENMRVEHVYNFYGLTETGVENFYHQCCSDDVKRFEQQGFVPIGKPLKGNNIIITDEKELLISGCQVTPGYLGDIRRERFEIIDGVKWFHSGDIVEKFEDVYFCKGRMDSQVKLNGYRIELMDIEAHMGIFKGVSEAVCFVNEISGQKYLVGYAESADCDAKELKGFLRERLPSYMIPKKIYIMGEFPRNKSGKIDRVRIKEHCNKE